MKQSKLRLSYMFLILLPIWGIMLLQLVVRVKAIKDDYSLYTCIFTGIMLILIGISYAVSDKTIARSGRSGKSKKSSSGTGLFKGKFKLGFNPLLAACWFSMCILMLISDIIVFKKYWFLSLTLLLLFTGLFVVWKRFSDENRDKLLSVLLFAIELGFLGASVFCFLFRPYTEGIRYSGLSANPNVYGIFLISVWCVLLTKYDYYLAHSASLIKVALLSAEIGVAGLFLFMTGARTAFLTIGFISLLWFIMRAYYTIKNGKPLLRYIVCTLAVCAVTFVASYFLLTRVPAMIDHPVSFDRDRQFTSLDLKDENIAYASDGSVAEEISEDASQMIEDVEEEPSPLHRILDALKEGDFDTLLNGRMDIYRSYIKKIDYKGHPKYGKTVKSVSIETGENVKNMYVVNAHNNVIQMAYSYGLLSAVPYVLLCILGLIYAFRYYIVYHDRSKIAAFPLLLIISFNISTLTECILIPFQSLLAFCFFICIGELMITFTKKQG